MRLSLGDEVQLNLLRAAPEDERARMLLYMVLDQDGFWRRPFRRVFRGGGLRQARRLSGILLDEEIAAMRVGPGGVLLRPRSD